MKYILFVLTSSLLMKNLNAGWLDRKAEGWFWYEDRTPNQEIEESEILQPPLSIPTAIPPLTATDEMAGIRKELEEKLNFAILEPTEANVFAYMQMQQKWVNRSGQFSQTWLKNLLTHPELDARLMTPMTQYGVQVQKQLLREQQEEKILSLTKSYGLFFFYEGNNKISQAFSYVVKEFSDKYSWQVFAISCDGMFIPGFENQVDHGVVQRLGVENFPSLYLVEPKQQVVIPIAFGLSSIDQIEENIELQINAHLRGDP
jgi:conjugal transfer pilus assembly protein TraF